MKHLQLGEYFSRCLAGSRMKFKWSWTGTTQRSGFKKGCVLLYFSSDEFESTLTVYWNRVGAAGLYCTGPVICEFLFWVGDVCEGNSVCLCVNGTLFWTLDNLLTSVRYVASRRRSPNFQLSRLLLSAAVTYVQYSGHRFSPRIYPAQGLAG